jgi:hypothetical protein
MLVDGSFTPTYGDNVLNTYPGYAVHLDSTADDQEVITNKIVKNCILYSEAFPAIGAGCNKNQYVVIEDCELIRNCTNNDFKRYYWQGGIVMHASNIASDTNCKWLMKDCVVKTNYGNAMNIRGNLAGQSEFTTIAIDNTFFSQELDSANCVQYDKGNSILSPMSHGNTASNLNYSE